MTREERDIYAEMGKKIYDRWFDPDNPMMHLGEIRMPMLDARRDLYVAQAKQNRLTESKNGDALDDFLLRLRLESVYRGIKYNVVSHHDISYESNRKNFIVPDLLEISLGDMVHKLITSEEHLIHLGKAKKSE